MALAFWAKSAVGTKHPFIKGLGKAVKSWREILQQTLKKKVPEKQPRLQRVDVLRSDKHFQSKPSDSFSSRLFKSLISSSTTKLLSRDPVRRILLSSQRTRSAVPLFSLIGITLAFDVTVETLTESGNRNTISGIKDSLDRFSWVPESLEKAPRCLDDLDINTDKFLAKGCDGVVYEAKVKDDSGSVSENPKKFNLAVKAVFNYGAKSNASSIMTQLGREMVPLQSSAEAETDNDDSEILRPSSHLPPHPNIVEMPGVFVDDFLVTEEGLRTFPAAMPRSQDPEQCFGRNKTMYLVMKKTSSNLRRYLADNPEISMATRCFLLAQLLEGLAHLRSHGVAHRDLKPDNLLVDVPDSTAWPRLEICDFGCCLAEKNQKMKIAFPHQYMTRGGNTWLMAPEICTAVPGPGKFLDFEKSDLWAAGTIAYEILGTDNPFYPSPEYPNRRLRNTTYHESQLPTLPDEVPNAVKELVKSLLGRDPKKRPSASVAATVVQTVLLSFRKTGHNQMRKSHYRNIARPRYVIRGRRLNGRHSFGPLTKEELFFQRILTQSLALYLRIYLTLKKPLDRQGMELVNSFVFLSRLTYPDFKASLKFF